LYHLAPSGECISGETEAELGVETLTQGVHHSTPILVADRRWLLISTPTRGFLEAEAGAQPWWALAAGLFFTGLLVEHLLENLSHTAKLALEVAQRRQTEEELRASEHRFRGIFDYTSVGILVVEPATDGSDFIIRHMNGAAERIAKLQDRQAIGKGLFEVFPDLREHGLPEAFLSVWTTGRPEHPPAFFYKDDRISLWLEGHGSRLPTGQLVLMFDDVTERKKAEDALRESEARYRALFEGAGEGILVADAETRRFKYANQAICRMFGYTEAELIRLGIEKIHPKEDLPHIVSEFDAQVRGEKLLAPALPCLRKDGTVFYADVVSATVVIGGRKCNAGFFTDVTERNRAEDALRESREKFQSMVDNIGIGVVLVGPKMEVLELNRRMREWFPEARLEDHRRCYETLSTSPQSAPCDGCPTAKTLADGGAHEGVIQKTLRKGKVSHRVVSSPVRDAAGNITGAIVMHEDITEKLTLQEQLHQSAKLESIGKLAGGVAHDFNNLLTGILGYAEFLQARVKDDPPLLRDVTQIRELGTRAANLTRQLLAFSRRQTIEPVVLNINSLVADMTKMLQRLIEEAIDLVFLPAADLGNVRADPGQIEQVLMNLAVNARDAMPKGGKLTIETQNVTLDASYAGRHAATKPGPYVMLAVSDTGFGMDQATRERLFEPFFTTKEQGKGTGLGLATVYGIVKQHGGNIWVYSEPGKGSTFKVYLPRVDVRAEKPHKDKPAAPTGGAETILVVEDESAVRTLVERVLTAQGYKVLSAGSPKEAETLLGSLADDIHLLLTDVVLPGKSGKDLYEHLHKNRPAIRVLYMSGYTDNSIVHHSVLDPGTPFVQKPFDPDALARKVRDVLDA
ncbi:MAG: PAS domain S-box protein, partial [Planctomycetota bacterium]